MAASTNFLRFLGIVLTSLIIAACVQSGGTGAGGSDPGGGDPGGGDPGGGDPGGGDPGGETMASCPEARIISSSSDLLPGPQSRGTIGDYIVENGRLKAVIQKPGRNWYNISQFGGNIIDALPKDASGNLVGEDHYEESVLGTNVESAPNYQTIEIVNAGGDNGEGGCNPAIVRVTGPDDLLDFVNGSSAIRDLGFMYPDSADDVDLPVMIQTDYILQVDQPYVTMDTRLINETADDIDVYMVEYTNGSGEVELFQYGYGFGELLVTAPCDSCRSMIYAGHEGGAGISYGIIHNFARTSSVAVSGVAVLVYGSDALPLFAAGGDAEPQPFTVPGDGELQLIRWFAVAEGGVSQILGIQYDLLGEDSGTVSGQVTDDNGPVAFAEISVITTQNDFETFPVGLPVPGAGMLPPAGSARGPGTIVASQFRTDRNGRYSGKLRPGDYELRLNVPNRPAGSPSTTNITVAANAEVVQDFTVPLPALLRVQVIDENDMPVPAKVQLLGSDSSPDAGEPQNSEDVAGGVLTVQSGIFGDGGADPLETGIVLTEFAVADPNRSGPVAVGDTGLLSIEPGSYDLSVSRGPRYSEHVEPLTLVSGELTEVTARIVRVVETPNIVFGDFHVHSFDSPDSEVTNRQRVATYVSEDMDFFTPSDHGMRVDFEPVIAEMGLTGLTASAPSAEVTTFDYGHFNAWPVVIDTSPASDDDPAQSGDPKLSQGSTDWGVPAPVGMDFPSAGHYGMTPAQLIADADAEPFSPGRAVATQINHVEGHFGAAGLEIDTGQTPPTSGKDPTTKRLPPDAGNLFTDTFDTLELWIGTDGVEHQVDDFIGENIGDWFNMMNQGILKTFVANSDTHTRRLTSMSTRNYISVPGTLLSNGRANPDALRSDPHTLADAVIAGYTTGSNALFMTVKAANLAGDVAGLEQTDAFGVKSAPLPLADAAEELAVTVTIQSAAWASFDRVAVYQNGATSRHVDDMGNETEPPRYNICPPLLEPPVSPAPVVVATIDGVDYSRNEALVEFNLPSAGVDYWFVVLAEGTDGTSPPLWPVEPNDFVDSGDGLGTRSAADDGTLALAVSNPIFVDADNDGMWTPPGVTISSDCNGGGGLPIR